VAVVAGFLLGGLAGLGGMLALGLSRTSRLPFGPWLVVGALLGVLVGGEVAGWFQASSAPGRPGQPLRTMMRPSMPV
jgi:leader peptidase (prepilin peptidase)/N-methyltransferase